MANHWRKVPSEVHFVIRLGIVVAKSANQAQEERCGPPQFDSVRYENDFLNIILVRPKLPQWTLNPLANRIDKMENQYLTKYFSQIKIDIPDPKQWESTYFNLSKFDQNISFFVDVVTQNAKRRGGPIPAEVFYRYYLLNDDAIFRALLKYCPDDYYPLFSTERESLIDGCSFLFVHSNSEGAPVYLYNEMYYDKIGLISKYDSFKNMVCTYSKLLEFGLLKSNGQVTYADSLFEVDNLLKEMNPNSDYYKLELLKLIGLM
jgi:hypothetical protein